MTWRLLLRWCGIVALSLIPLLSFSVDNEDARSAGCWPQASVPTPHATCNACHKDGESRWAARQARPCTNYCMSCHKKAEMSRHHTVGTVLPKSPNDALHLTADKKLACFTCHDLSRQRYDQVRWKATSLYDRMFRKENRYKTYFLAQQNDQGQLCLECH